MRPIMMKFNNDRREQLRIQTTIYQQGSKRYATKKALVPEAEEHLKKMYESQRILQKVYKDAVVCPAEWLDGELQFPFFTGESLSQRYESALRRNDKELFLSTIKLQKELILSCDSEMFCDFDVTEQFEKIFGDGSYYIGQKSLKITDFEFTSHNIILGIQKNKFGLIDYELVFDFPMPIELILYHCVITTNAITIDGFQDMFSKEELFSILDIRNSEEILEYSWRNFIEWYSAARDDIRQQYLKKTTDIAGERERFYQCEIENNGHKNYIEILTKSIYDQQAYIKSQESFIKEKQNCILHQRAIIKMKEDEIAEQEARYRSDIKHLQQELSATRYMIQEEQCEFEKIRGELEGIKKSMIWRATAPIRMFLDRIR